MFHSDITGGVSLSMQPLQLRATMLFLSRCFSPSAVDGTDLPSRWLGIETLSISQFTTASFQTAALDLVAPLGTVCETLGPHWCLHCRLLPCKYLICSPCPLLLLFFSLCLFSLAVCLVDLVNSLMDLEVVEALLAALGIARIQACDDQRQHDMFEKVLSRVSENRGADQPNLRSIYLALTEKGGSLRHRRRELAGVWR